MRSRLAEIVGVALALFLAGALCASAQPDPPRVGTSSGRLEGVRLDGFDLYRGIPYAAPPVGALRWKPPQPAASWTGVRAATAFAPPCPSIDGARIREGRQVRLGGFDVFIGVPLAPKSNEDCLYLNVWAPRGAKRAAVMVWIQPLGDAALPVFDGSAFARDGVVFVSFNYRQLTAGNFAHPALTAAAARDEPLGRFQAMDQMAALRWVKQNIAAFGGDPHNVTIFGESAGASSTLQLLTIPAARGLFDKAIVESGAGWWSPLSLTQMERLGAWAARQAGLPGASATEGQLRTLAPGALPQFGVYSIDGRLQPQNATDAFASGRFADVPLLIGWNDFDGSSLRGVAPESVADRASQDLRRAYASDGKAGADLGYQMYTDSHVAAPARWIASRAAGGSPSYLYLFSYVRSSQRGKVRGAAHGDEIAFVFDAWDRAYPQLELSAEDRAVTRMIHSCWVSFARSGAPKCEGAPEWPRYTPVDAPVMELNATPRVLRRYRERQLDAQEAEWKAARKARAQEAEDAVREIEGIGAPTRP